MLKMNKVLLFLLITILISSFVSAITLNDARGYWSNDNGTVVSTTLLDISGNSNDLTLYNGITSTNGILIDSLLFNGVDDYAGSSNDLYVQGESFSISYWIRPNVISGTHTPIGLREENTPESGDFVQAAIGSAGEMNFYINSGGFDTSCILPSSTFAVNNWYHVVLIFDNAGNNKKVYVNNAIKCSQASTKNPNNMKLTMGSLGDTNYFSDTRIDEVAYYTKVLNDTEISVLYNGGAGFNPYSIVSNESLERTIFGVQNGTQLINSPGYVTILSANFNVTKNNTKSYLSVTNMVSSTAPAIAECRITLNGLDYNSPVIRNIDSGTTGNMYLTTDEINLLNETVYTANFECKRNTGGSFTLNNSVGVGHLLVNQAEEDIPYMFNSFSSVVNDDSVWTLVDSYNFVVNNVSASGKDVQKLVIDWSASYENTGGSDNVFSMFFEVVDYKNCSITPRTVGAGTTGSVGGNCLVSPVNSSDNLTINVYAKGLNANFTGKSHTKNFFSGSDESNSLLLNATSGFNESFQLAFSMLVNNTNHDSANMFFKNSVSVSSNISTYCEGFSVLRDGGFTQTGNTVGRTVTNDIGVLNFQWIYNNASTDNYSLDTYIRCDDVANLTFIGEPIIYLTDSFDLPKTSFTVSLIDNFDNGSIGGFNVTLEDGTIFSFGGTFGEVFVDVDVNLTNLTVTTDYLGGYFPVTVLNHNVSNSLSLSLNQSIVNWDCVEKVSGVDLVCNSPLESEEFNYNTLGNPYSQSVNVSGYFERFNVFNITPLFNGTKISDMYTSNLSVNVNSEFGAPISCSYNVSNENNSFSEVFVGNPNSTVGLINGSYNVTVDCIGFALQTKNITINESFESLNFTLFTTNSVFLRFFDTNTGDLLNGTNVTVIFIGATAQTNSSSTGELFVDLLNPSEYTILFSADDYRQGSYIFRIVENRNLEIDLFMEKVNDTELVLISVIEKYSKDPIQGALVTIQKYKDNGWVTDQIVSTDFQGFTEAYFVISTEFYNFVVEFEGQTFFGVINSNENKKTIFAEDVTNGISIEIDTSPENTVPIYQQSYDVVVDVRYNNVTNTSGFYIFEFDDTNNIPRNVVLNVTQDGVVVCTNSVFSESGNINCAVSVPLGDVELFTGTGFILFGDEWIAVDVSTNWVGVDPTVSFDWESTGLGYIMSFFIVLIAFLLFAKIPSMSMLSGTLAFISLIVFRVLFNGINLGLLTGFLFAAYLLSRIPSKSGVNA